MNSNEYETPDRIIRRASSLCGDPEFVEHSKWWYRSIMQYAMEEIHIDTLYNKVTIDVEMPSDRRLEMPSDFFNPGLIFVYADKSCCEVSKMYRVFWKNNFDNKGSSSGNNYSAKIHSNDAGTEIFNGRSGQYDSTLYANIQNGMIFFSKACENYGFVRLYGNGFGGTVGDKAIVPKIFTEYITNFICREFFTIKAGANPRLFGTMMDRYEGKLESSKINSRMKAFSSNKFQQESIHEYISNIVHK